MSKKHTPEQIIRTLREVEAEQAGGATIAHICQKLGVSEQTFHRWRAQYRGMKADDTKRRKDLEADGAEGPDGRGPAGGPDAGAGPPPPAVRVPPDSGPAGGK